MSSLEWLVTFEARDEAATMNPSAVPKLSFELSVLAALGAFLQIGHARSCNTPTVEPWPADSQSTPAVRTLRESSMMAG
jgi:hypothetical protein